MDAPIVIVGASLGGLRTAEAIRRSGETHRIVLIGDEPHYPYNRTPLSKELTSASLDRLAFPRRSVQMGIDWRLGTQAVGADLDQHFVVDHMGRRIDYAALVVATGTRPRRLTHRGKHQSRRLTSLRTIDDVSRIANVLTPHAHVLIVGGGFIGCEVAATLHALGYETTVVVAEKRPLLGPLGESLSADLQQRHHENGIRFVTDSQVADVEETDIAVSATSVDGRRFEGDLLIEAIGSKPNIEWLAGNDVDIDGGVRTDSAMRAARQTGGVWPEVFAVGDVARFPHPLFEGRSRSIQHWNIPTETGRRAGNSIAAFLGASRPSGHPTFSVFAPMPSFWSDQGAIHLLSYGLPELGTDTRLLHGASGSDCVYGYFRAGMLVGVCGIGYRSVLQSYRAEIAASWCHDQAEVQVG